MKSPFSLAAFGLAAFTSAGDPALHGVALDAKPAVDAIARPPPPPQRAEMDGHFGPPHNAIRFFSLIAHGPQGAEGPVGQLANGQARIGGGVNLGQFYMMDGRVMDSHHRGCILTPVVNQWQCDEGGIATSAFSVSECKKFTFNGNDGFFACPVNDNGEWNIYVHPIPNQNKCIPITLSVKEMPLPGNCPFHPGGGEGGNGNGNTGPARPAHTKPGHRHAKTSKKPVLPSVSTPTPAVNITVYTPAPSPEITIVDSTPAPPSKYAMSTPPLPSKLPTHKPAKPSAREKPSVPAKPSVPSRPKISKPKPSQHKKDTSHAFVEGNDHAVRRCPLDIKGAYEKPKFIVRVDQTRPNAAFGSSNDAQVAKVAPDVCTIFSFDIPNEHSDKQCSLNLFLPRSRLNGKENNVEGNGNLYTFWLESPVKANVTWNSKPRGNPLGKGPMAIRAGQAVSIQQGPCPVGEQLGVQFCGDANMALDFSQDDKSDPIGLFMRVC